jgi:hypothetical protein
MPCMVEKIATIYAAAAYFGVFNKRRPRPTPHGHNCWPCSCCRAKIQNSQLWPYTETGKKDPKHGAILKGLIAIDVGIETVHAWQGYIYQYHANNEIMIKRAVGKKQSVTTRFSSSLLGCMERSFFFKIMR